MEHNYIAVGVSLTLPMTEGGPFLAWVSMTCACGDVHHDTFELDLRKGHASAHKALGEALDQLSGYFA